MRIWLSALVLVLGGCATQVYHPERDEAAMQKDIAACTEASVLSSALNVAAKEDIMACLKDMGYRKGERAAGVATMSATPQAPQPCVVPCKKQ